MNRIEDFLRRVCGFKDFEVEVMRSDASSRCYWRVRSEGMGYVLMDGDAKRNRFFEFVEISRLLNENGVAAPKVFFVDMKAGLALLEDLGDGTFSRLLEMGADEKRLYELATDLLIKVVKIRQRPEFVDELSKDRIVKDACFFVDWYYPMAWGKPLMGEKRKEFVRIMEKLVPLGNRVPSSMLLWDYHVDNVMLKDENTCAVIDFQDAYWGSLTYDIMSLLEDARREVPDEIAAAMKAKFFGSLEGIEKEDFDASWSFWAMFRHMRVLGRFSILLNRGKDRYVKYVWHLWKMLARALENEELKEMKVWVDENMPAEMRKEPVKKPITKAMILAAGRGSRMRELGDETPKPLIKVKDKAMIDYKLKALRDVEIKDVVVNVCWQGEKIKDHLAKVEDMNVWISEEVEALETGGGVKKALDMLGDEPFFTLNSDTLWKDDGFKPYMAQMIDKWDDEKYDIMLMVTPLVKTFEKGRGYGDYRIKGDLLERNKKFEKGYDYFFSGVALVHPRVFEGVGEGKFSMRVLWDEAEKKGKLGFLVNEAELFHVGTPEDRELAEERF